MKPLTPPLTPSQRKAVRRLLSRTRARLDVAMLLFHIDERWNHRIKGRVNDHAPRVRWFCDLVEWLLTPKSFR